MYVCVCDLLACGSDFVQATPTGGHFGCQKLIKEPISLKFAMSSD